MPSGFGRTALAWCTIQVLSQSTLRWMRSRSVSSSRVAISGGADCTTKPRDANRQLTPPLFAALLQQLGDQTRPAGLMARSDAGSVVAVKVLLEGDQVPPVRVFPKTARRRRSWAGVRPDHAGRCGAAGARSRPTPPRVEEPGGHGTRTSRPIQRARAKQRRWWLSQIPARPPPLPVGAVLPVFVEPSLLVRHRRAVRPIVGTAGTRRRAAVDYFSFSLRSS